MSFVLTHLHAGRPGRARVDLGRWHWHHDRNTVRKPRGRRAPGRPGAGLTFVDRPHWTINESKPWQRPQPESNP
jgi:hypothetical protein